VVRLNTTPVKSTALHHPEQLVVTPGGVAGDRRYLVLRADGSRLRGAAKAPLLGIVVTQRDRDLRFAFADGAAIEDEPRPAGDVFALHLYDRDVPVRFVEHAAAERLSDLVGERVALAVVEPPGHAGGHHPLSLVSLATVADVGYRGGASALDARRFRATLELEGCEAYEEDRWAGRTLRIGEAVVGVSGSIPRCVLTTLHPDTGEHDFATLEVLAGYRRIGNELPLGVYGDVQTPGVIRVGDPVEPLDADRPAATPFAGPRR
jgi:uncharacterized protein YcbX